MTMPSSNDAMGRQRRSTVGLATTTAAFLLAGMAFVLAAVLKGPPGPTSLPLPVLDAPLPGFIGATACAGCHAAQHRAWLGSHHRRAMEVASNATVQAPFAGETAAYFGRESRFFRGEGGGFRVLTEGPDGTPTEYEVTHSFGVAPLQQYLVPFPGGRLQPLPWAWDTRPAGEGGQRWFHLYPEEDITPRDPLHWTGRIQTWNRQCAACHATALHKGYDAQADAYVTTAAEMGVSCEACHGAGARHVAWARGEGVAEDVAAKGFAPRLPPNGGPGRWAMDPVRGIARWEGPPRATAAFDTCAGCHARRREIAPDPAPGTPFLDAHAPALLDTDLYQPDGAILGEVFEWGSFVQSRMHRAGVTCTDCHRPHSGTLRAEGNALCLQCHAPERFDTIAHHRHAEGGAGAQCTACHMAARTYMGVHVRHDHSFRVPRPDLSVALGTPNACTDCHTGRDAAWAAARVAEWHGEGRRREPHWGAAIAAGRNGARGADERLITLAGDHEAPGMARATALSLLSGLPPGRSLAPALRAASRDPDPLVRMAAAAAFSAVPPADRTPILARLLADPVRAVRLEAVRTLAPVPDVALPPEAREARAGAMAEYLAAARHNADQPDALGNLGNLLAEAGRAGEAEAEYRAALRLDAGFVPARIGLSELLRRTGRERDAETALREGIAVAPGAAALHHALGLSLARQRRGPEALDALAQAARLDADNPRFAFVYGVALNSAGRPREAFGALRAALVRHPANRDLLLMLALIARDAGARDMARGYLQQILAADPGDQEAQQLLDVLMRRR